MRLWRALAKRYVLAACSTLIVVAVVCLEIIRHSSQIINKQSRRHRVIDSIERIRATPVDRSDNFSNDEEDVKLRQTFDEQPVNNTIYSVTKAVDHLGLPINRAFVSMRTHLVPGWILSSDRVSRYHASRRPIAVSHYSSRRISHASPTVIDYSAIVKDYFQPLLNDVERATLRGTLIAVVDALDAAGVTFWVDSGTLLGSYRHQDFIPWDDDADLLVRASDRQRARQALDSLGSDYTVNVELTPVMTSGATNSTDPLMDACWRVYSTRNSSAIVSSPGGTYGFPHVDLMFYAENDTHVWAELIGWWPMMIWPKSGDRGAIFPIRRRPLGDRLVPAPCDVVGVLRTLYGGGDDPSQTEVDSSFLNWCHSASELHRTRTRLRRARIPCSALANLYPFVRRGRRDDKRNEEIESLLLGNTTIRNVTLRLDCRWMLAYLSPKIEWYMYTYQAEIYYIHLLSRVYYVC